MNRFLTLFVLLVLVTATVSNHKVEASPVLKLGSKGQDITDLQFRLQTMGFYNLPIDNSFGKATRTAVQVFQKKNGLQGDGVVGPKTWAKLKKLSVNKKELSMLARVIYAEARGEEYKGQVAVGAVVMNRLQSSKFPNTVKEVIMEPNAFSAVKDGQYWLIPNQTAFKAAKAAVKGNDPTGNALFFFNPIITNSAWFKTRTATKKIGSHQFTL
ncbi:spore cortex-lytic enzyme [Paenibacillus sp. FSL A5-0031]|uniref:cell wall hydrolase n=1 Tax=Paenibacillus sp. FSL A5-0031 TaxID=1920420 RepID=UPI00096F26B1|nr:cell wall hydrolase [Paenibacillus sp. FSL A5-0031]OME87913.1 spore cortex-lytic enzyme [Paenibacillus sp. FSL A5-0031]